MIFSIVLGCMMVAFVTVYHFGKMPKKQHEKIYSTMTTAELIKLMQSMHCELVRKIDDDSFVIGFQGGYFQILRDKSGQSIQMFYKDFYACSYEQSKKIVFDVNGINRQYTAWSCYLRKRHEDGESEKPFSACLSTYLFLSGSETQLKKQLRLLLEAAFIIARSFKELTEQPMQVQDALARKEFDNRLAILRRKLEMGHGELKELTDEFHQQMDRVEGILSLFEEIKQEDVLGMTLISGEKVEKRTEPLSILSFRLKDAVMDEDGQDREEAVLYLELTQGHLVIVLEKASGSNKRSLYFKLSAMHTDGPDAFFDETQKGRMVSSLIEIRLTTENEDYWELKYMVDDARDKAANKHFDELTEEQQALLAYTRPTLQTTVYWGKKFFRQQCYLQALGCYLYIFRYYQEHWVELSDKGKEEYYVICYHIGFVYLTLGFYEKAFYHLTNAKKNSSINAIRDFTNCLIEMKDTGAIEYIYSMVSMVNSQIKMYGDENNVLLPLYHFLRRRATQVLVSLKYFAQARELLYQMLGEEENREFAKRELKYLESMDLNDSAGQGS
jgi:tetratricopeptide (TPR) repeat protein